MMKKNYIIVGDSITYGIGDYETNGWASMLKNKVLKKDETKQCSNYVHQVGFPGATSKDILEKLENIIKVFGSNEFDNTIVIAIGVNDTQIFNGKNKVSIQEYKNNIEEIIEISNKYGYNIIFVGLTRIQLLDEPFLWKPNKYYDNKNILKYDNELEEICKQNNIKYISMEDVLNSKDFIDGLHPNHSGHKKMFEKIATSI